MRTENEQATINEIINILKMIVEASERNDDNMMDVIQLLARHMVSLEERIQSLESKDTRVN